MFALCRSKHHGSTSSDAPPVDLSVGDIRSQIAAEWLQIAQRSQWRAPPSLFRMVPSLTPYDLPFPQNTRMTISPQRLIRSTYIARSSLRQIVQRSCSFIRFCDYAASSDKSFPRAVVRLQITHVEIK